MKPPHRFEKALRLASLRRRRRRRKVYSRLTQ